MVIVQGPASDFSVLRKSTKPNKAISCIRRRGLTKNKLGETL